MDLDDTPEEAAYRAEVRAWLDAEAEPLAEGEAPAGFSEFEDPEEIVRAKAWQAREAFQPGTNLRAWVFSILRNQYLSGRRRAWRTLPLAQEDAERSLVARPDVVNDDDRRNLARTLGYFGDLYLDLGDLQQADAVYWESHQIREDLSEAKPRDYERKYQLGRSWDNFGGYQTRQRILGSALHFYRQSEKVRYTMVNGRLYDSNTLEEVGSTAKRAKYWWER